MSKRDGTLIVVLCFKRSERNDKNMKQVLFGKSGKMVPAVVIGCMRMNGLEQKEAERFVKTALELGANFFDHADIYSNGVCETMFGNILKANPKMRENIILQSKCGIVPGVMYDCSKEHIIKSVDGILKRLQTDYLDSLLLHRPDALMEPEEVAEAFEMLKQSGKVRYFGVSNQKSSQIQLLSRWLKQEIMANQLQFSITNSNMVRSGMEVNMETEGAIERDGSILDFCRLHDITIQAWSPFQYGFFEGVFIGNAKFEKLNQVLKELAEKYHTTPTGIATAWILRHPAKMQMIAGTMKVERLKEICQGAEVHLERKEWYDIYMAAGHILP